MQDATLNIQYDVQDPSYSTRDYVAKHWTEEMHRTLVPPQQFSSLIGALMLNKYVWIC